MATRTSPCRYASSVALQPTPLITPQLKFASGSLAQYLSVRYSERLPSSSAVDEIEPTLSKFIPPGYSTDEQEFLDRVEHDATHFKPYGEKIYSYTRAATTLPKGKNVSIAQVLGPDDEETVDFEVYHVSARLVYCLALVPLSYAPQRMRPLWGWITLRELKERQRCA